MKFFLISRPLSAPSARRSIAVVISAFAAVRYARFLSTSSKSAQWKPTHSPNQKYTFRTWLLRLGLIGEEFKNCRKHLLSHLEGNIAWLHPEDAIAQRERLKQERIAARSQQREQQAPCEPAVAPTCHVPEEVRETAHEEIQGVVSDCEEFDESEEMSMTM